MKRIVFASLLVTIVLGLLSQNVTGAFGSGPSANGGFQFLLEDGNPRFLEFEVHSHPKGARGSMTFTDPSGTTGGGDDSPQISTGVQITANFDCLRIEGNRAVMGGAISSSNIPAAIGQRVILVVEDNGEGIDAAAPDRLTWGVYGLPATGWTPKDSERDDDNGAFLNWIATDFERPDDVGIPSNRSNVVRCETFPLGSYSFINVGHGNGNLQVRN